MDVTKRIKLANSENVEGLESVRGADSSFCRRQ